MHVSQYLPDLRSFVPGARSKKLAIRGPGYRPHTGGMTHIGINMTAIASIPYLHGFIATGRSHTLAIGRPCHPIHEICMNWIDKPVTAISRSPYLPPPVHAG